METFFAGSAARTMASLLGSSGAGFKLSQEEKQMLSAVVDEAEEKGR